MKLTKGKLATFIIMIVVFLAFSIFAIVYYYGESYNEFYGKTQAEFSIPGLDEGFVPQGMEYEQGNDIFLISGYMANGSASRVYVVNGEEVNYVTFSYNGETLTNHFGGITTDGTGVWIGGEGNVYYLKLENLLAENEVVEVKDVFKAPNGADCLTVYYNYHNSGNCLIVGEFYREGSYDTDPSHHITTECGRENTAVSFAYQINNNNTYGLLNTNPAFALSTTSQVQGIVITNDQIILSTSYSLPSSTLYFYDNILETDTFERRLFEGLTDEVDTYILDEPVNTISAPPMTEEIAVKDDSLYILFENACSKYNMFTRVNLENVYSLSLAENA